MMRDFTPSLFVVMIDVSPFSPWFASHIKLLKIPFPNGLDFQSKTPLSFLRMGRTPS